MFGYVILDICRYDFSYESCPDMKFTCLSHTSHRVTQFYLRDSTFTYERQKHKVEQHILSILISLSDMLYDLISYLNLMPWSSSWWCNGHLTDMRTCLVVPVLYRNSLHSHGSHLVLT
jgi:hypothetical protein